MNTTARLMLTLLMALAASNLYAQTETERENAFLYGVSLSSQYDDRNADSPGSTGDFIYSLQPHIGISLSHPRWETVISYQPGLTYSIHRTNDYDLLSHSFGLTYGRRFTKRLRLDLRNTFTLTSNPFDAIRADASLPPTDVLDRPNSTLTGTVRSRRAGQALLTLTHALSARSSWGMRGNFMHLEYRDGGPTASGLTQRTLSGSGSLFYQRATGKRSSMEARYEFLKLDFDHGAMRTDSHSLLYIWNFAPTHAVNLSLFAGPSYSITRSGVGGPGSSQAAITGFHPVGGGSVTWMGGRTSLTGSATQQISDGGGTQGGVRLVSFIFDATQQLSRNNSIRGFATYNMNHLLAPVAGASDSFNYLSAGGGFSRKLTERTSLGFFYWRIHQDDFAFQNSSLAWNRVGITLSYEGQRPLGRK